MNNLDFINPICFSHSADFDGMCSAALVRKYFNNEVEIYPIDYSDKEAKSFAALSESVKLKKRTVIICDFSFNPRMMREIADAAREVIWLDHHASAVADITKTKWFNEYITTTPEKPAKISGLWIADEGVPFSGAYLTWAYFYNESRFASFDEFLKAPEIVKNISIYDTWCFANLDEKIFLTKFQYGMKAAGLTFDTVEWWNSLLSDIESVGTTYDEINMKENLITMINEYGNGVYNFNLNNQFAHINKAAYPVKIKVNGKNLKGLALNVNGYNSEIFESIYDPEKTDFFIKYYYNKDHWSYSVYVPDDKRDKVSAVDIVRSFDPERGGGHNGAAGGNSDKFISELVK